MGTITNPIYPNMYVHSVVNNGKELVEFAKSELLELASITSLFAEKPSTGYTKMQIGNESYRVVSYVKMHDTADRVLNLIKGLALTIFTLGIALIDIRVRTYFNSAFKGYSVKHAAIANSITIESVAMGALKTLFPAPLAKLVEGVIKKDEKPPQKFSPPPPKEPNFRDFDNKPFFDRSLADLYRMGFRLEKQLLA